MARKPAIPLITDFNNIPEEALVPEAEQPFAIPDHWKWVRLQFLCTYMQRGKGPKYSDVLQRLAISQKCVRWTGIDLNQARGWDRESFDKLEETRILRDKDILWNSTGTGTLGRLNMLPVGFSNSNPPSAADSHVTVIRVGPILLAEYLELYLSSEFIQYDIEDRLASGTTNQRELNLSTIKIIPIPLPPLDEQKNSFYQVKQELRKISNAESHTEKTLETLERIEQGLIQSAFDGRLINAFPDSFVSR